MTTNQNTQPSVHDDKWLQRFKKIGLPLGIMSAIFLIVGQVVSSPLLGNAFLITMPAALIVGFTYNIRYISLAVSRKKASNTRDSR
ncbi:MAG: hypothetical protein ACPGPF_01090 [Pontibacterium sp.]